MKRIICVLMISFCLSQNIFTQSVRRYIDSEFNFVQTHTNQVYATAPQLNNPYIGESATSNVNLTMHIFQPQGDNLQERPMLVCFHGGGFVSGNKEHDDMMEFCKTFARKGYVTATAQYRLGMNLLSNTSGERSVYRAVQDSRALLRYLRENAATLKISPEHIYILGSSAGAFIALHNILMNKESERPAGTFAINNFPPTTDNGPDLGALDAIGSYLSHSSQANGIIPFWGAVKHTDLIEVSDSKIPIFLVHGSADLIVPFGLGSPFQAPTLTATYGSQLIDQKLTLLNYPHETYFVQGEGHEFYGVLNGTWNPAPNQYWNIVVDKVRDFLFNIHKPTAAFNHTTNNTQVAFTNTSISSTAWRWDFGDNNTSTEQNPVHTYAQSGNYNVTLTAYSEVYSADVLTKNINVIVTALSNKNEIIPNTTTLFQNYPNPFNPETIISWQLVEGCYVTLKIYDSFGRTVETIVNQFQSAGSHKVTWQPKNLSSGIYFYKLTTENYSLAKKLIKLK